jgi:hypothetical protein
MGFLKLGMNLVPPEAMEVDAKYIYCKKLQYGYGAKLFDCVWKLYIESN